MVEDVYDGCWYLRRADPTDERYGKKLNLLLKYEFITPGQHTHMKAVIGCERPQEKKEDDTGDREKDMELP